MYAQLCKRLSEEAPNFEPADKPCTFRLLLLNKCRAEFENRASAFEEYEGGERLSTEEEERRHLAKRKMLGNIKFIGELGKLNILHENILHLCIKELLARRTNDEDLECLAQLVRTCGRILDTERSRKLMDQYFQRMETFARNAELQPRIRFMLRDVIELRRGGWIPRPATAGEGPVPIQQLRGDDSPPPIQPDPLFRQGIRTRLDDVLGSLTLGLTSPSGSLVTPSLPSPAREGFRSRYPGSAYGGGGGYQRNNQYNNKQQQQRENANSNSSVAPRFNKSRITVSTGVDDVQMRPDANSLLFTANKHRGQPTLPPVQQQVTVLRSTVDANRMKNEQSPQPKSTQPAERPVKPKKEKGPSKEDVIKQVLDLVRTIAKQTKKCNETIDTAEAADEKPAPEENGKDHNENTDSRRVDQTVDGAAKLYQEMNVPDKYGKDIFNALLNLCLNEEDVECAAVWQWWRLIRGRLPADSVRTVLSKHPHNRLPLNVAHLIVQKVWSLSEVSGPIECHAPLLVDVLAQMKSIVGMEQLLQLYNDSKIRIGAHVVRTDMEESNDDAVGAALEKAGLTLLEPVIGVARTLLTLLRPEDQTPVAAYKWMLANLSDGIRNTPTFGHALMVAVLKSRPDARSALRYYTKLLQGMLQQHAHQMHAVYGAQVYAHSQNYPKGKLLQLFMDLYEQEICEREAFMLWQEDVDDSYPGKGEALFQVNVWLTWLQGQVSSDEEA